MQEVAVFDIDKTLYVGTLAHDFVNEMIGAQVIASSGEDAKKFIEDQDDTALVSLLRAVQAGGEVDFFSYQEAGREAGYKAAMGLNARVEQLLSEQIRLGKTTIAISTSPYAVVKPFCDAVGGFDIVIAPRPQNIDGKVGPRSLVKADERHKGEWLKMLVDQHGFTFKNSVAIGDTMSDAPMLELVSRPIAHQPNSKLRELAIKEGWEIWD